MLWLCVLLWLFVISGGVWCWYCLLQVLLLLRFCFVSLSCCICVMFGFCLDSWLLCWDGVWCACSVVLVSWFAGVWELLLWFVTGI